MSLGIFLIPGVNRDIRHMQLLLKKEFCDMNVVSVSFDVLVPEWEDSIENWM